jgi:hypothetical protein
MKKFRLSIINYLKFLPMKKVFFLIAFLFSVVCYAGPPPDILPTSTDEVVFVSDLHQVLAEFSVLESNVQEVTFVGPGSFLFPTGYTELTDEPVYSIRFAEIPVIWVDIQLIALNKPPSFAFQNNEVNIPYALRDKQHTNYGYPHTANKVSRVA